MGRTINPIATAISLDGPFFTYDPAKTFRKNGRTMLDRLADEGEADVKAQLQQSQATRKPLRYPTSVGDRVSDHVYGRVDSWRGKPWQVTAIVGVKNFDWTAQQGRGLMAAASRIEGRSRVFKRTATRMRKSAKINAAELLKNIA